MKLLVKVMVLFACVYLVGCMTVQLDAVGYDKQVTLTSPERKYVILKHFNREMKCYYTLLNLIPLNEPSVAEILRDETISAHGDGVANVRIAGEAALVDFATPVTIGILGLVTAPPSGAFLALLIGSRTYTIEGDIIRYVE